MLSSVLTKSVSYSDMILSALGRYMNISHFLTMMNSIVVVCVFLSGVFSLCSGHYIAGLGNLVVSVFLYYYAKRNNQNIRIRGEMLNILPYNQLAVVYILSLCQTIYFLFGLLHGSVNMFTFLVSFVFTYYILLTQYRVKGQ